MSYRYESATSDSVAARELHGIRSHFPIAALDLSGAAGGFTTWTALFETPEAAAEAFDFLVTEHDSPDGWGLAGPGPPWAGRRFGKDHPEVAGALNTPGAVYRLEGKLDDAKRLYDRALAICVVISTARMSTRPLRRR